MNGRNYSFAFIMLILWFATAKAQKDLTDYEHYTVSDGLPTQTTYNLLQDIDGFLWIATDAGVSRFDGKNFVNYTTEDGLGDNEVLNLYQDRRGRMWFIPFGIKQSYYLNGKFYTEDNDTLLKTLAGYGVLNNFIETKKGEIVAQVRNKPRMVVKIDTNNSVKAFDLTGILSPKEIIVVLYRGSNQNSIYCITSQNRQIHLSSPGLYDVKSPGTLPPDAGVKFWFQNFTKPENILYKNDIGVYAFNDSTYTLLLPSSRIPFAAKSDFITFMDKYKNIWVSNFRNHSYFFRYVNNGYASPLPVLKDVFSIVAFDNEDNVWFCTANKGLYKIPYKKLLEGVVSDFKSKLLQKNILCMHTDAEGTLWLGYGNGYITQVSGAVVKHHNLNFGSRVYNRVMQIQADAKGNIWCATDECCVSLKKISRGNFAKPQMLRYPDGKGFFVATKGIVQDKKSNVYITIPYRLCKASQQLKIVDEWYPDGTIVPRIYSSFFDSKNRWYVSTINGLKSIEGKNIKNLSATDARLKVRIQHFAENTAGVIFLATYSDGVLALKNNRVIASLGRMDGLAGVICRKVYLRKDTLYIVTNGGITIATYAAGKFSVVQNLGLADGLPSIDVNDISFLQNTLYAATSEGLSTINLPIERQSLVPPPVLTIMNFKVNEMLFSTGAAIVFPYKQQQVRIEYIAPVMVNPQAVKYRYRFTGKNGEWHTTSATQLEFNDLHHGNYRIEIQAKKSNSNWGVSKEIIFTILPPFYSTWTFKILVGLGFFFGLYVLLRYRFTKRFRLQLAQLKQNEAVEKERNRIAADIHDDIGAELTHIVLLSRILKENSPQQPVPFKTMVDKLEKSSNEVINKMNEVIWTLNASSHTLHNLVAYIHNYSARLLEEHGLKNTIVLDESVFSEHLIKADVSRNVFLIVKETLHNIIKHSAASRVDVCFTLLQGPVLFFEIKDNGRGFDAGYVPGGNGLRNMNQRADVLHGAIEINSYPDAGCIIKVKIPL